MPTVSMATLLPAGTLIASGRLSCENMALEPDDEGIIEPQALSSTAAATAPVKPPCQRSGAAQRITSAVIVHMTKVSIKTSMAP